MTRPVPTSLRQEPRRYPQLRNRLLAGVERAARALGGRSLYRRRFLGRGRLCLRRERIAVADLAPELEGLRIVHLSDIHAGAFLGRGDLAHAVELANEQEPDLCVLTGDYITHEWREGLEVDDEIAGLRARLGVFAVFGNHDYHGRCEGELARAWGARGVTFLRNAGQRIRVGAAALYVSGLEDLEEGKVIDADAARAGMLAGDVEIVLCHNPRGAAALAGARCAAVLSGHTHGTQLDVPWLRRRGPVHPGLRVELGATTLIVNRGLGVTGVPWRVGSPAEVVVVELAAKGRG